MQLINWSCYYYSGKKTVSVIGSTTWSFFFASLNGNVSQREEIRLSNGHSSHKASL